MILKWMSLVNSLLISYIPSAICRAPSSSPIKGGVKAAKDEFPFIVFINNPVSY